MLSEFSHIYVIHVAVCSRACAKSNQVYEKEMFGPYENRTLVKFNTNYTQIKKQASFL